MLFSLYNISGILSPFISIYYLSNLGPSIKAPIYISAGESHKIQNDSPS